MLVPVTRAGRTPATDFTVLASLVGGLLVWLVLASYALGRSQRQAVLHLQRDVARYVAGALDRPASPGDIAVDTMLTRLAHDAGLVIVTTTTDGAAVLATVGTSVPGRPRQFVVRAVEAPGTGMAPGRRELLQLFVSVALAATCVLGALLLLRLHRQHEETVLRGDFVRVVSHELRTPLAQILMFAETLRLGRTRAEADRTFALDVILQEARRLARLVDNVLRFTRLEQADIAMQHAPLDVAAELRDVASQFTMAGTHDMPVLPVHVSGDPVAIGDRDALRQVLMNLLDNAYKHGGSNVQVELSVTHSADTVQIAVEDSGPGLHHDDLDVVWAPFARGQRGQHGPQGDAGTGLGLTIVRGLVSAMRGEVRYETRSPGHGARFVVSLPAYNAMAMREQPAMAGAVT